MTDKLPDGLTENQHTRERKKRVRRHRKAMNIARLAIADDIRLVKTFTTDHLRIELGGLLFDFWPSTGKWAAHPLKGAETRTGGLPQIRRYVTLRKKESVRIAALQGKP